MDGLRRGEVNLWVSDFDRSTRFYAEALGFRLLEDAEGWRKLSRGGIVLTLFRSRSPGPAPRLGEVPGMSQDLHVDDLEGTVARLRSAGAEVEPVREWEEGRFTFFRDPDGIAWELISP